MKRVGITVFCVLSLFVLSLVGNATAYNAAYTHTNYLSSAAKPTANGQYAMGDEWAASLAQPFGTNGIYRDEWCMPTGFGSAVACFLIETADASNDAGDYWVMCFDSTAEGGETEPNGGAAPKTDDYKLVVTGHGASATVQWYKGTGTGWNPVSSPNATVFEQGQSLSATVLISTPHYVLEVNIDKVDTSLGTVIVGYNWAEYVAYYDAHAGGYGLQSWPPAPASPDVPDSWGYITYSFTANENPDLPENIGITVMLTVSSGGIAGAALLRKRKQIAKLN